MSKAKDNRSRKDKNYYERQRAVTEKNKRRQLIKRTKKLEARKDIIPPWVTRRFERRKLMRTSGMRKPWTAVGLVEQVAHRAELADRRPQRNPLQPRRAPVQTVTE